MSLQSKLREMGVRFTEEGGVLKGGYHLEDGRSQLFALDPDAEDFGGHREYDFLSFVGPATDKAKIQKACELVGRMKRGGIVVREGHVALKIEVPADLPAAATVAHLQMLVNMADAIEREVFGGDAL